MFLQKIIENALFHFEHCQEYRRLLMARGFTKERIQNLESAQELPFLTTLYLKRHRLLSVPERKIRIMATSSGTSGNKSTIGYDLKSLWPALGMVLTLGKRHRLFSLIPSHYVILGYEYSRHEKMAVMKTAYGQTWFTPALSRTYALAYTRNASCDAQYIIQGENGKYILQSENVRKRLIRLDRQRFPVRITGFPFYAFLLLEQMKKEGIRLSLPKGSLIAFGGGWKQHGSWQVEKKTMYRLVWDVLGIPEEKCLEFFGAAEHPALYCACRNHHFHVPVYARVVIRDVETYEPVKNGTPGLVNLISPGLFSMPVTSILTDDLGILHDGTECGCGIQTPYLELLGRTGVKGIKTCAAVAAENGWDVWGKEEGNDSV